MVMNKPDGILSPKPESKEEIDDDNAWTDQWKQEKFTSRNLPQMYDVCNQISTDRKTEDRSNQSRNILTEKNWLSNVEQEMECKGHKSS